MTVGPVSLFDNVRSNIASDCVNLDFDEFVQIMEAYSQDSFASKSDAPLICLTQFEDGRRKKANAGKSAMLVLDIDDHLNVDDVASVLKADELTALLCSTASHRLDKHKFRVFIPLSDMADYDDHRLAWHVANLAIADGKADPSKIGSESMFFVPGIYPNAPSVFHRFDGVTLSADEWINLCGLRSDVQAMVGLKPRIRTHQKQHRTAQRSLVGSSDADLDLARSRLVTDRSLDEYRSPSGAYHHARFRLLMSMAGRARQLGVDISHNELVHLFNQVDQEDGSFYQTPDYQTALLAEAQKALTLT